MNEKIANILKTRLETLDFADKIAGLVKPMMINVPGKDNAPVAKIFPVAHDVEYNACINGRYQELVPNSKYRTIIYFEDGGTSMQYVEKRWVNFASKLNLVCWINIKQLGECYEYTESANILLSILAQLPEFPISDGIYRDISIKSVSEAIKSNAIFGRYSYDEKVTQYLMYPFDYFMLNLSIDYRINLNCVTQFKIVPECIC